MSSSDFEHVCNTVYETIDFISNQTNILEEECKLFSSQEVNGDKTERIADKYGDAEYMASHLSKNMFDVTLRGINEKGLIIELSNHIQGLMPYEHLIDNGASYNPETNEYIDKFGNVTILKPNCIVKMGLNNLIYKAEVSGMIDKGIFVRLDNAIEGFLPFNKMSDDWYQYDAQTRQASGKNGNLLKISTPITVVLEKVDVLGSKIDFMPPRIKKNNKTIVKSKSNDKKGKNKKRSY